ncbi:MAG: hypothetical protein PHZ26_03965 [Candidatus Gracilibacteria bacterium]|nr:hypothetical protein [Candidatus Gracilibacteria bacterium]MDD2908884.1 hypothetical protein [Candidatus Gracilibacteria bacterium]
MKNVEIIAEKLASIGHKIYVVGSYNVHTILKKNFGSDVDLTTPARPEEIRKVLKVVGEIGAKYGTLIVREGGELYEITSFRKDIGSINHRKPKEVIYTTSLEKDAKRRDFTFNAIYYNPLEKTYTDPVGGISDLEKGLIRFVGNPGKRLDEDILRLLRYIRLKNKYGLSPAESSYKQFITSRIPELHNISLDRIKQEFDKMLVDKTNISSLEDLKKYGFFREFLPQIDNLSLSPGGKIMHKEGNVWIHTLMSLQELNHLKCNDSDIYWTTILHDIGKYSTYSFDDLGNIHYFGHEEIGLKIFTDYVVKQLPFSKKSQSKIKWLIKNHIRIGNIENMKKNKSYELMSHPYFEDLITLCIVDNLGKNPPNKECGPRLQSMYSEFQTKLKNVKLLTGDDIMKLYPELKGKYIGLKLKTENNKILERM